LTPAERLGRILCAMLWAGAIAGAVLDSAYWLGLAAILTPALRP
jgi:hypothetical protein